MIRRQRLAKAGSGKPQARWGDGRDQTNIIEDMKENTFSCSTAAGSARASGIGNNTVSSSVLFAPRTSPHSWTGCHAKILHQPTRPYESRPKMDAQLMQRLLFRTCLLHFSDDTR